MSALDNLSPSQLGAHVRALAASGKKLDDPNFGEFPIHELKDNSHSRCGIAAMAVEEHLDSAGVGYRPVSYSTGVSYMSNHYATEVPTSAGPHVVDLALRQYDENAGVRRSPWPLVEHRDKYLRRHGFTEDE